MTVTNPAELKVSGYHTSEHFVKCTPISMFFISRVYMEVFVIMIQSIFHLKSQRQRTLRLLFEDCRFIYLHSLMRSDFLPRKGLLCLYDKQNNTWLLVDMEFLFSCSTRHLTRSLRSLVSYRVKHSKINSISTRAHVLFPIYYFL